MGSLTVVILKLIHDCWESDFAVVFGSFTFNFGLSFACFCALDVFLTAVRLDCLVASAPRAGPDQMKK